MGSMRIFGWRTAGFRPFDETGNDQLFIRPLSILKIVTPAKVGHAVKPWRYPGKHRMADRVRPGPRSGVRHDATGQKRIPTGAVQLPSAGAKEGNVCSSTPCC